ncbi:MAG TPA: hypothetical protein PKI61_02120, partial [bacterium]|nr:hypothetical protein [bacterium]
MAAENYRLEKAKTAVDPSIMVRLGNDNDGTYPGGVEIAAQTTYLLVDEEVEADLRAEADAVISNSGFSWGDSGYTLYLGTNAISSSDDQDIQDFVGFGDDAVYYESNPTLALEVNHYLERKLLGNNQPGRDSDDNQADFVLLSSEAEVVDNNDEEENDDNNSEENTPDDNSTSTDPISTSTDPITPEAIPTILIARIFATGDDDAVELYNPNDEAVDLAAVGYRLEKSKTSSDPSIIMRIGNDSDGTYPGGTIIGSHQTYLIARDEAGAVLKSKAQAIAATSGFTWDGDGYSLFLGTDAISGTDDADLVDLVGFGPSALYYEGSAAAAIGDNYILTRKASAVSTAESMANSLDGYGYDSGNNSVDFVLVGDGEEPDENDVDNLPFNQSQDSNGLIHLWHFDECFGANFSDSIGNNNLSGNWVFQKGLFGCGLYLPVPGPEIKTVFADKLDISQMTLSFWQQTSELGRIKARFYNRINPAADVSVSFSPLYTEITGLPSSQRFYGQTLPNDNAWHQMFWVIDSAQDTWRLYIDGQFVREGFFDVIFSGSYDTFSLS